MKIREALTLHRCVYCGDPARLGFCFPCARLAVMSAVLLELVRLGVDRFLK
jgi:hypothetical protein